MNSLWDLPPLRLALLLAVLCALPSATLPFMMDDWFHLSALDGWLGNDHPRLADYFEGWEGALGEPSCFAFFPGGEANRQLVAAGRIPWWTGEALQIHFFRPLSSLTHLLDHTLFGARPLGHHLHSILWYLALVAAVGLLYRRILPGRVAAVAAVLYAIDDSHWFPTSWIANRNALIAAAPAILGLLAHVRWQESGWRAGLPLSLLGLSVGLAGGEAALGVFGMLGAYQLLAAPGGWRSRGLGLLPALALGLSWAGMYRALGYGAHGSGLYIDPGVDPGAFAAVAPARGLILLGGQILGLPADAAFFAPALRPGLILGGGVAAVVVVVALRWAWPAMTAPERRHTPWLLAGGLIAMLPGLATFPVNRMLLVPGIGLGAVIAIVLSVALRQQRRGIAALIALPHLALAVPGWWGMTAFSHRIDARIPDLTARMEVDPGRDGIAWVAPDPAVGVYLYVMQAYLDAPFPRRWQPMSMAPHDHRLTRLDETTFHLEVLGGAQGHRPFELLFRSFEADPLQAGDRIESGQLTVTVAAAEGGHPTALQVTLHAPMSSYQHLIWTEGTLRELPLPDIGQSVLISYEPGPMGL